MIIYLKETLYFRIDVQDGTDRKQVTEEFSNLIQPQFEQILSKIKFSKEDKKHFEALTGNTVDLSILSKRQFLESTGSKI
jgi:hypothetical protein